MYCMHLKMILIFADKNFKMYPLLSTSDKRNAATYYSAAAEQGPRGPR